MKPVIVITFHSSDDQFAIETNALLYNAVLLYKSLLNTNKYRVAAVSINPSLKFDKRAHRKRLMNVDIDFITYEQLFLIKPYAIIECMCDLSDNMWRTAYEKIPNIKRVRVRYGNQYYIVAHEMIAQQHILNQKIDIEPEKYQIIPKLSHKTDQIWISPHFSRTTDFYNYVYDAKQVKIAPYLWNDNSVVRRNIPIGYTKANANRKNILIMENNLHVIKNSLLPFLICEAAVQKSSDTINKVYLTCAKYVVKNDKYKNIIQRSDLMRLNKLGISESYIKLLAYLKQSNIGTVVSHNIHNELNYFHLECMRLGIMLIHNSECHKDYGFYYPDFEINTGRDQLIKAINSSDTEVEQVLKGYQQCIDNYSENKKQNWQTMERYLDELAS